MSAPPPVERCEWLWIGLPPWEQTLVGCQGGTVCDEPTEAGSFIGETASTDCHEHD